MLYLSLSIIIAIAAYASAIDCPASGIATIPHPYSCDKYIVCRNGQETHLSCANGLLFDQGIGSCFLKEQVTCKYHVCPQDTVGVITMLPHPEVCSNYFLCSRGEAILMECAVGLNFNRLTRSCDLAQNVDCRAVISMQAPPAVQCQKSGVSRMAHPTQCGKYFLCIQGEPIEYNCAGDLVYDEELGRCNLADKTKCSR